MHSVVSFVAQAGLYVVALLAVCVWVTVPRPEKVAMVVEVLVGLVAVAVLVKLAGAVHSDPGRSSRTRRSTHGSPTRPTTGSPRTTPRSPP